MSWVTGAYEALERELIKRERDKRQRMLDAIAAEERKERAEDRATGRRIQEENLRQLEAARKEQALKLAQARATQLADVLGPDADVDDTTATTLAEGGLGSLIRKGQKVTDLAQVGTAGLFPILNPTAKDVQQFRGTHEQLEEKRKREARAAYIKSLPPGPQRSFLEAQDATGDMSLPFTAFAPPKEDKPAVGSFEDFVLRKFGPDPTPAQISAARREYGDAGRAPSVTVQMGGLTPAQVNAAMKLADDYQRDSKPFIDRSESFGTVVAASKDPSAAGDLSIIFAYMKMLDPGSVVREGEFATAQNTAGVPDRVRNTYNNLLSGVRLSPTQRADFLKQARHVYTQSQQRQAQIRRSYEDRARRFNIPVEHVVMDYGAADPLPGIGGDNVPAAVSAGLKGKPDGEYKASDGTVWIVENGQIRRK